MFLIFVERQYFFDILEPSLTRYEATANPVKFSEHVIDADLLLDSAFTQTDQQGFDLNRTHLAVDSVGNKFLVAA